MHQYLRDHLAQLENIEIITPKTRQYGCQFSLLYHGRQDIAAVLKEKNVVFDLRNWEGKKLIRIAPVPLYNTFQELDDFITCLKTLQK
jgi:kynureninase